MKYIYCQKQNKQINFHPVICQFFLSHVYKTFFSLSTQIVKYGVKYSERVYKRKLVSFVCDQQNHDQKCYALCKYNQPRGYIYRSVNLKMCTDCREKLVGQKSMNRVVVFLFDLFLNTFLTYRLLFNKYFTFATVFDCIFRLLLFVFVKEGGKELSQLPNQTQCGHYF